MNLPSEMIYFSYQHYIFGRAFYPHTTQYLAMKIITFRRLSIKLFVSIYIPACIIFILIIAYLSQTIYQNAFKTSSEIAANKASFFANEVQAYLEHALVASQTIANSYTVWKENGQKNRVIPDLLMRKVLAENKNYLSIWSQFEYDENEASKIQNFTVEKSVEIFGSAWLKSGDTILQDFVAQDYENFYDEEFYTMPKQRMTEVILEPYFWVYPSDITKKQYYETSCIQPLMYKGKFFGAIGIDIELTALHTIGKSADFQSAIVTNKLIFAMHNDTALIGKSLIANLKLDSLTFCEKLKSEENFNFESIDNQTNEKIINTICKINLGKTNTPWYYLIQIPANTIAKQAKQSFVLAILLGTLGLVALLIILLIISRNITNPLLKGINFAQQMANGNLYATYTTNSHDEIKLLSDSLNNMTSKIREIVVNIKTVAESIRAAGKEISVSATTTSESASQQAASIEQISSSIEQIAANINQNADNAMMTEKMATEASLNISEVGSAMEETIESLKTIVSKISVINEFAERTNMLAINAAIEAARAGEFGKGFAIVASEIRELSISSQNAAQLIDELSKRTVANAERSGKLIGNTIIKIGKTAQLVQEIAISSSEQRHGVQQVNIAVNQINNVTQHNAASAEQLAATAIVFMQQAENMQKIVSFFKLIQQKSNSSKDDFIKHITDYLRNNFDVDVDVVEKEKPKNDLFSHDKSTVNQTINKINDKKFEGINLQLDEEVDYDFDTSIK